MAAYDDNQDGKIEIREVSILFNLFFFIHCHLKNFGTGTCQIIQQSLYTLSIIQKQELMTKSWIKAKLKNLFLINYFYNNYFWF